MNKSFQSIAYDEPVNLAQGGITFTPIPKATGFQRLKDIGASFAGGAVGATKAIADAAGADNAVSAGLGRMQDATQGWLSPERQAEQERRAAAIDEAEKGSSRLREIGAHLGGIVEAPVSTLAQAAGSVAPVVASMLATRGRGSAALVGTGLGVAQGAGAVKGSIHEAVKNEHLQTGATDEAASAAADQAQSYGGPNTVGIALGGALGGLASRLGVEGMVTRGMAGAAAAGGSSALRRMGVGAVSEGVPEAIQGGQERHASNVALQREGFETPAWQGVAGQAAAEGVAGGMLGGVTNTFTRGARRVPEPAPAEVDGVPQSGSLPTPTPAELAGATPATAQVIDPADNPETGVDPELLPTYQAAPNPADGPLSRNVSQAMGNRTMPSGQPAAPRSIHERIQDLPEDERTQATILADEINNLETPEGVRLFRRGELDALLQASEQRVASGGGPISRGMTANRPSTALATSELSEDDPADWHKTYRRNPVGVPYQNTADPLGQAQQAVRQTTEYTDQQQVQAVRNELEDSWLALNVGNESVQQSAPALAPAQDAGDITPEIDARVRAGRVVSGARNAFDAGAPNTLRVIQSVNQALRNIGEQSLTQDEIARIRRVADARTAFMGLNLPASLPADRVQQAAPVDAMANNSGMESMIPERRPKQQGAQAPANLMGANTATNQNAFPRQVAAAAAETVAADGDGIVKIEPESRIETGFGGGGQNVVQAPMAIESGSPQAQLLPQEWREAEDSRRAPVSLSAAPAAQATQGSDGRAPEKQGLAATSPELSTYSREEILAREAEQARAQAQQPRADLQAQQRAQADRERSEFTLTGSDRASDANADQADIFAQSSAINNETGSESQSAKDAQKDKVSTDRKAQDATKPVAQHPTQRIEDVGEKIGGARKDVWTAFREDLGAVGDDQIKAQPLSKVWPQADYQKLIDAGASSDVVAMVRSLRDAVETKPRASHKVKRWADHVAVLRSFAADLLDGKVNVAALKADIKKLSSRSLRDVLGRAELYEAVGHEKSLEGITFGDHQYSLYRGRKDVHLWAVEQSAKGAAFSNWPREIATGDTKEQALEAFKKAYANLNTAKEKKSPSFDIITEQFSSDYFVGKKLGRTYAKLAGPFKSTREAREHRDNNEAQLLKALEVFKQIPQERADENRPRVGQDTRQGADVTPEQFRDAFGFRGVEFGNWMEQGRRQQEINEAYDALMDMAAVLQLPAKAISLNGELALAFGARGSGGVGAAKAHYEPGKVVINLTKRTGAGSLGHEWWHAADNYFSRMRSQASGYMTDSSDVSAAASGNKFFAREDGVRPAMIEAFGVVMRAINATALRARSAKLDERRTKDYWSTDIELSARAFESYLIGKLQDQSASNDYLANVVSPRSWEDAATVGLRQDDAYPYPTADEIQSVRAGFDHFFQTVEIRETDHGLALFSSRTAAPETQLSLERVQQIVQSALAGISGAPPVHVVRGPADLGLIVSGEDVHSGVTLRGGDIYVFQSGVGSELDVLKTVFHELFHRGMRNILPADQYVQSMLDLAKRDDRVQSYANEWKSLPVAAEQRAELAKLGYTGSELQARFEALAIEEGLAVVAEELKAEGQVGTRSMRMRGLAAWLASVADKLGFTSVADAIRRMSYNEAERFVMSAINASGQAMATISSPSVDLNKMRTPLTDGVAKAVGDTIKGMTVQNVRKQAGFKVTDYMGIALQFLGRRQLTEVYSPVLPQLKRYSDLMARMDADKNEAGADADEIATEWGKLKDEGPLADLMHDATLAQIDPAKDYVEGDNKTDWKALKARFDALTPEARGIYQRARDSYRDHMHQVRQAIKERIERSGMTGQRKADMIKQMEGDFFGHIKGVYFPLSRFGQYVVVVKNGEGKTVNVSRAETMAEADALRATLAQPYPASQGYSVGKVLKSKDFVADRDTVGSGFIQELYNVLDKQGMDAKQRAELEDSIGQLYLASMPDLSWAKHGIHRKGTAGFSQDARRGFAQNTFHGARYLAKLRYSDQLQDELTDMDEYISMHDTDAKYPSVRARQVLDEMVKRHDAAMNPAGHPLSTALTSFGFMFHLGLSPASAMVNLTQTALVAYPVMGAKWGFAKSSEALLRASKETIQGKNDISRFLNADEKAAFDEAARSGVIDVTMAHDLAGIAQGEDSGVMWKIRPMMKWASFLFHHAEKFNRSATFVASYRLARDAGSDHFKAYEEAVKATYDGHFDYSSNNRPRFMQGNVARVLLLFKQYSQNMIYAFARSAQQSMKGQSAKERAEARKALGGLLVMHGMAAGALGLPMVSTLLAVASMLGGDDDEPFDAQAALQNMLADTFGQKPAEVMAHGLSRLTPWDISGRVGLDNLIMPDLQEGLEGQRLAESAMAAALGPVAGIGVNVLRGVQNMAEGEYLRGLEAMMPSFLRNPIKSIRYAGEGVQDKSGIVVKDEVDYAALLGQFAGFSPSEVRLAYEGKAAINKQDRALAARRSTLMEQFALAAMAGDEDGKAEARVAISRFNEKNPSRTIKPMQLAQSVRMRQRRIDQSQEGVYLPKNRRDALGAGRFAVSNQDDRADD